MLSGLLSEPAGGAGDDTKLFVAELLGVYVLGEGAQLRDLPLQRR
jgi:hypothetical protein